MDNLEYLIRLFEEEEPARDPSGAIIDDAQALAKFRMERKKLKSMGPEKYAKRRLANKKREISGIEDPQDKSDQQQIMRLDMQREKIVNKIRQRQEKDEQMKQGM